LGGAMHSQIWIVLLRGLHTAVFFFVSMCVVYVLRCGIVGKARPRLLLGSIAIPTLIGLLWLVNGHECVLSSMIYWLANGDRSQSDIYLPVWFARWIMTGTTIVLVVGVCIIAVRSVRDRRASR
jgi:hypothetical protein